MGTIADAKTAVDNAQADYNASPSTATRQALAYSLTQLIAAIQDPKSDVTGVTDIVNQLSDFQNQLATAQTASSDESAAAGAYESATASDGKAVKSYQITVPHFMDKADGSDIGTSFLRLGSFAAPPAVAKGPNLKGEAASVQLANIVGDPSRDTPAVSLTAESQGAFSDDTGLLPDAKYGGDATYLYGFADDTRYRNSSDVTHIDGQDVTSTVATRQAETKRLLSKGGWWDHSDGNRVTTTAGDKIEVIQGNYKMVVLGRQDPSKARSDLSGGAFITDVSGGHFAEQYASPTPCIKTTEYTEKNGVWTLVQDNGEGNVTTHFKGIQQDFYLGPHKFSQIGSDPADFDKGYAYVDGAMEYAFQGESEKLNPELVSKTWAQKIETYVGSANKPVTHIATQTYASEIQSYTFAASIVTTNAALNNFDLTIGIKESVQVGFQGSLCVAGVLEIFMGGKYSFTPEKLAVTGSNQEAGLTKTQMVGAFSRMAESMQSLSVEQQSVAVNQTQLAAKFDALATMINLGV